jgi:hypothetical protein
MAPALVTLLAMYPVAHTSVSATAATPMSELAVCGVLVTGTSDHEDPSQRRATGVLLENDGPTAHADVGPAVEALTRK